MSGARPHGSESAAPQPATDAAPAARWQRAAGMLVLLNLIAASLHCLHNVLFFERYPEPAWISGPHIVDGLYWLAVLALVSGYLAFRRRWRLRSGLALLSFCAISVSALGHYLYAPMTALPLLINALILLEAGAALVLAAFVIAARVYWPRLARCH